MARRSKIKTPDWIMNPGSEKKKEKKKGRSFKIRRCPKCKSDEVRLVLGKEEGKKADEWECKKCGWKGKDIREEEISEEEFLKYLDEKGEEVA